MDQEGASADLSQVKPPNRPGLSAVAIVGIVIVAIVVVVGGYFLYKHNKQNRDSQNLGRYSDPHYCRVDSDCVPYECFSANKFYKEVYPPTGMCTEQDMKYGSYCENNQCRIAYSEDDPHLKNEKKTATPTPIAPVNQTPYPPPSITIIPSSPND